MKIAPSVLACDLSRLCEEALAVQKAGAELLHLDVMDGHFVSNLTFGAPVIKKLRPRVGIPFDTHLMISDPLRYINDFADAGSDSITFHLESDSSAREVICAIKKRGIKVGIAIKPGTPHDAVLPYLAELDMVLVMTVEPGFGGQSFIWETLSKIERIRQAIDARGLDTDIQVDGGIDEKTIAAAKNAGANVFVAGSAIFSKGDYKSAIAALRNAAILGGNSPRKAT